MYYYNHGHNEAKTGDIKLARVGFSYEVLRYSRVTLDGCPDYMWKTVATFQEESEAKKYIAEYAK